MAETRQVYEAELIALRLREPGIEAEVVDQTLQPGAAAQRALVRRGARPGPDGAGRTRPGASSTAAEPLPEDGESE